MKFRLKFLVSILAASAVLTACSTASVRIMPSQKGLVKVIARDIEMEGAEEAALKAATNYCEERDREVVFLKEQSKYTGSMDEATRKGIRSGAKAVQYIPGGGLLSSVGKGIAGDRDYQAAALFKCQKAVN